MSGPEHEFDAVEREVSISPRRQKAKVIVLRVLEQRESGKVISDHDVLLAHPDVSDELKVELKLGMQIRQALLWARNAAPPLETLPEVTDSQIDAPIGTSTGDESAELADYKLPHLPGYFILGPIGQGGQATVYRATQESTGRLVAVKVISGGPFISSRQRTRFDREARILATLDHPNIVGIIHQGRTPDGSFFFVMQYVDGIALDEYWRDQVPLIREGTRLIVQVFVRIAKAVAVAHANGIIHRDLKPSNLLVDQNGEPQVLDFGLARNHGQNRVLSGKSITSSGQIIGSLPWASPEQAAGMIDKMAPSSDVYSLGIILYQALTGHFPVELDGPIDEVLYRIRMYPALPPSQQKSARLGLDRSLDAIVLQCLAKCPASRYQSAQELAADLEAWLAGNPLSVRRLKRARPSKLYITAAIAAFCLCLSVLIWQSLNRQLSSVVRLPGIKNSLGMRFVQIPTGRFLMGSPDFERGRDASERQHIVTFDKPFFIGVTDVTQDQYQRVMHSNPSDLRWRGSNFPVQNVSWANAIQFCQGLGEIDHLRYRLPTEDQWEYACRARSTGQFMDGIQPIKIGWYLENSDGQVHPVAEKLSNAWGLFDMHGNVAQWCAGTDIDSRNEESDKPIAALCVIRGGSALLNQIDCRSASRPGQDRNSSRPDLGFRVVCEP